MRAGKDFMSDKPGVTTFEQLDAVRRVQQETKRIWTVNFTERFEVRAVTRALDLVRDGAIGDVVQTVGLGPHRENRALRDPWFYDKSKYGGILVDIASHQIDQFLVFAGVTDAEITLARAQNVAHPDDPAYEDFGEIALASGKASAYIRVDWFTPDGLPTWGDGRLFIYGTRGTIELRKYVDPDGRPGKDHLFLIDGKTDASHRLQRRRPAVLRQPAPRHRRAHRDRDAAGARVQGVRAGAGGAGAGGTPGRRRLALPTAPPAAPRARRDPARIIARWWRSSMRCPAPARRKRSPSGSTACARCTETTQSRASRRRGNACAPQRARRAAPTANACSTGRSARRRSSRA